MPHVSHAGSAPLVYGLPGRKTLDQALQGLSAARCRPGCSSGYRLLTGKEWEYACRAGSFTYFSVGEAGDLLPKYAWSMLNSQRYSHPVGTLRPNDLGLFDMHGNAWEWCQDREVAKTPGEPPGSNLKLLDGIVTNKDQWFFRGGAFTTGPLNITSIAGFTAKPSRKSSDIGFSPDYALA